MIYTTVKNQIECTLIEKKSRFIANCKAVKTEDEAKEFIKEIRDKYKDARHNVYAYSLRNGGIMRYSDDKEPQGTAGIPTLEVLKKANIVDTVVVVTRYFGGILLGAGGLVRAYSGAAALTVTQENLLVMKECVKGKLKFDYGYYTKILEFCTTHNVVVDDTIFEEEVSLIIHALETDLEKMLNDYNNLTRAKGSYKEIDRDFYGF